MTDNAQRPEQAQWTITVLDGREVVQVIPFSGTSLTIGREIENDISLDDLEISRHHARITRQAGQLLIEDLNSANGTLVNSAPLTEPHLLRSGDVVSVGMFKLKFEESPQNIPYPTVPTRVQHPPAVETSRSMWPWLIIGGLLAIIAIILIAAFTAGWFVLQERAETTAAPTVEATPQNRPSIELIQAPSPNNQLQINQSVTIQAIASDPAGVTRLELWVNGTRVDQMSSSLAQSAPSIAAAFQWTPEVAGTYTLELRAYNQDNRTTSLDVTTVTAIGGSPTLTSTPTFAPTPTLTPAPPTSTPTQTPTPTPTPLPPTPTPAPVTLVVNVPALNVRTGPSTQYEQIGRLSQGQQVEIVGQANAVQGQWWQIVFPAAPGGLGWVSANPSFVTVLNTGAVPTVVVSPPPATATPLPSPTPSPTATTPPATVIRPPDGKTLVIISNRSTLNQPARLTLSGGKSVGGGEEFDPPPNGEIEVVLEPDFYRALWSSPARGGFARGVDFTAVAGKVVVMWIVPEEGLTDTEVYDQLTIEGELPATPTPSPSLAPQPAPGNYTAAPGRALLVASNRSVQNQFAVLTLSGGNFGGGRQFTLDANTETPIEMLPGDFRAIWTSPAHGGFSAGRDFTVYSGAVIEAWIIPEDGQVFMQFPGQPVIQINN